MPDEFLDDYQSDIHSQRYSASDAAYEHLLRVLHFEFLIHRNYPLIHPYPFQKEFFPYG